jgi:hypothetical protein
MCDNSAHIVKLLLDSRANVDLQGEVSFLSFFLHYHNNDVNDEWLNE